MTKRHHFFYCMMPWIVCLMALPIYWLNTGDVREAIKLLAVICLMISPLIIHEAMQASADATKDQIAKERDSNSEG